MTPLLLSMLALLLLYGLYVAVLTARNEASPGHFLDAGGVLPGWAAIFLLPGLAFLALGGPRHLDLVARYGLQASHLAVGIVLFAMMALLLWNRMWYVARIAGAQTPGEALGQFYGSITLRIVSLGLAILYGLPFAADMLSGAAMLLDQATSGFLPHAAGVWLLAFALAVPAIVGGWRATILMLAAQSLLLLLLLPGAMLLAEVIADGPGYPSTPIPVPEGVLWDRLPGVIQYSAGLGKEIPPSGIFTSVALSSSVIALLGFAASPALLYLGQTLRQGKSVGIASVWLAGGLTAGMLILGAPLLATRLQGQPLQLAFDFQQSLPLAGAALIVLLMIGMLLAVSFFSTGGAILVTRDFIVTYLIPELNERQQRFAAKVAIGFAFFFVAFFAAFLPQVSAILASLALPLSVQLLPALLGLAFFRWISRGAVLAGMILGMLIVFFTEPPGLILFEGLFVDLPWGRWPLTIHSAAWGLAFNLLIVCLSATVTQRDADAERRRRLHDSLADATGLVVGGRGLLWTLTLLWGFLAYGPGSILGNSFFSHPIFTSQEALLGIPSLWVWQILFWLLGVVLIWWLAYRIGLGVTSSGNIKPIVLEPERPMRTPDWLAASLGRVKNRT